MEKANSIVFLLTKASPVFGMAKEFESDIRGPYSCQGEVNSKILERASKKPEPPVWRNDAPDADGHPNKADIEALNYQIAELISEGTI